MKAKFTGLIGILVAGLLLAGCAGHKPMPMAGFQAGDLNAGVQSGKYVKAVDNFIVIMDASQSMDETYMGRSKFDIAKDLVGAMGGTVPKLDYNGSLRTYGHSLSVSRDLTKAFFGPAAFNAAGFEKGLASVKVAGGTSPLADAITAAGADLKPLGGKSAIIIVSDGKKPENAPVAAAAAVNQMYGDGVCFYTVLVGDDPAGKKLMESLAQTGACGSATTADQLAAGGALAGFMQSALLAAAPPAPAPVMAPVAVTPADSDGDGVPNDRDKCPGTPAGAKVNEDGCWVIENITFDFNKAEIKPEFNDELNNVAEILARNYETKIEVGGHTDNVGSEKYNQALSERRANAVMEYLVAKGVGKYRITAKGYGFSRPHTTNDTEEGRAENRRVELGAIE
ncbi:MAG: OmpA family protein [Desulfobacterales bacterium]|nr:OmpA family protein [Desulfobacterales bacterium]